MQCLENGHVVAALGHFAGKRESGGARTYHGHFHAAPQGGAEGFYHAVLALVVGGKAFEISDSHGLSAGFKMYAARFALLFLRTHAPADGRQRAGFFDGVRGFHKFSLFDVLDEAGNVDTHGAALHATGVVAVEAAASFHLRRFHRESLVHFLTQLAGTVGGVELRHRAARLRHAFLGLHGKAELFAPLGIARCVFMGVALVPMFQFFAFLRAESREALEHLVEIYLMPVELRSVNAHELRLTAHGDTAGAAHSRAVHHNGVERNVR